MPQRRTVSVCALLLLAVFAVAPLTDAAEPDRGAERAPAFLTNPFEFLGAWFHQLLGFETAATGTQGSGCGEAGPQIDPDGRCVGTSNSDAGPDIDPDGR